MLAWLYRTVVTAADFVWANWPVFIVGIVLLGLLAVRGARR